MTLESPTLAHPVLPLAFCCRERWEYRMSVFTGTNSVLGLGRLEGRFPRSLELWNRPSLYHRVLTQIVR